MRILQVHNLYASEQPSGENSSVQLLADGLDAIGHEVVRFWPRSDDLRGTTKLLHGAGPLGLSPTMSALRALVRSMPLDVALVHNVYPTMGPRVASVLQGAGVAVVHVVHNYRHSCITGTHYRNRAPCFDCVATRSPFPGIKHACYRGSHLQSAVMGVSNQLLETEWRKLSGIVHLSRWMESQFGAATKLSHLPATQIYDPVPPGLAPARERSGFLFAGRLAPEKGVMLLLEAWRQADVDEQLHIAGDGPLRQAVHDVAPSLPNVVVHGALSSGELASLRARTSVACVPAQWDEPFGRVGAEAQAASQALPATPRGALPELVTPLTGSLVPETIDGWVSAIRGFSGRNLSALHAAALANWKEKFHVEASVRAYSKVLEQAAGGQNN